MHALHLLCLTAINFFRATHDRPREVRAAAADLHDARQRGHVAELLDGRQEAAVAAAAAVRAQLVEEQRLQGGVHVEAAGHAHVGHEAGVHLALHAADAPDEAQLLCGSGTYTLNLFEQMVALFQV